MEDIKSQEDKLTKFPYFPILEWMYEDLRLSGNTLIIFAYIFRECVYFNRNSFNKTKIAKKFHISNPTVISAFSVFMKAEIIINIGSENNIEIYEINSNKIIAIIHDNVLKRFTRIIKKYNTNKKYDFKKELDFLFPNKSDGLIYKLLENLKASCNLVKFKNNLNYIRAFEDKLIADGEYIKPEKNRVNFWDLMMNKIRK